jgi:hypothetical protein
MVDIRHFIWPEYTTTVLKRSLLMMAFSKHVWNNQVFFSNWDFGGPIGKRDNATAQNLYYIQPY